MQLFPNIIIVCLSFIFMHLLIAYPSSSAAAYSSPVCSLHPSSTHSHISDPIVIGIAASTKTKTMTVYSPFAFLPSASLPPFSWSTLQVAQYYIMRSPENTFSRVCSCSHHHHHHQQHDDDDDDLESRALLLYLGLGQDSHIWNFERIIIIKTHTAKEHEIDELFCRHPFFFAWA